MPDKEETLKLTFDFDDAFSVKDGALALKDGKHRPKVCIMGFAPSWKDAPFDDPDMDFWCLNEMYDAYNKEGKGRASLWFEIHSPDSPSKNNPRHQAFLANCPVPVVMQERFDKFPLSVAYPLQQVLKMVRQNFVVNPMCGTYTNFSNQVSWMVYMAILMKYEEIHVYGVDMAHESEYAFQRPSAEAAILFAAAKGVKVGIPLSSELCHFPKLYGFESDNASRHYKKKHIAEMTQKKQKLMQERANHDATARHLELQIAHIDGILVECQHDLTNAIV